MKVKRYLAKDRSDALHLIRRDLGRDAIIISSRWVRQPGLAGFFAPRQLEVIAATDDSPPRRDQASEELYAGLGEVKNLLRQLVQGEQGLAEAAHEELVPWRRLLMGLEFNADLIDCLLEGLAATTGGLPPGEVVREALVSRLGRLIPSGSPSQEGSRVCCLVGPPGVGKTTTLAKLAAQAVLREKKRVALVTIDTYRIGAVDQLRTYAEILGVPLEVAMAPEELRAALARFESLDAVFIDTAGRSAHNTLQLRELKRFLDAADRVQTHLVLSATTKEADLRQIVCDYKVLGYQRLIFTKVDETARLGPLVQAAIDAAVPLSYLTNGQNVPDDLQVARPEELAHLILKAVG